MANQKVSLWMRVKIQGQRRYVRPANKKSGMALVNGQAEKHIGAVYHLCYSLRGKQVWEGVGTDYLLAEAKRKVREGELELNGNAAVPATAARLTLAEQKTKFLELKQLQKKSDGTRLDKETLDAYEQHVTEFLTVAAKKVFADQIDAMDLRRYMLCLENRGLSHRTVCNDYTAIATFLKFCGVDHKELLPQHERPRPDDGTPEAYTAEEIVKFLSVIKRERDRLFFEFLLKTGAREKEATYAEWTDITGGPHPTFTIRNKAHLGFRTKTGKSRVVPLERGMYERLMMWKEKNPGKKLIFGTRSDKPDGHFLETCKLMAYRAGLNCGGCAPCLKRHECEHWYLHKWRATYATIALRAGTDIRTVQSWLGHHSLTQTERYLQPMSGQAVQEKVNAAFGLNLEFESTQPVVVM